MNILAYGFDVFFPKSLSGPQSLPFLSICISKSGMQILAYGPLAPISAMVPEGNILATHPFAVAV